VSICCNCINADLSVRLVDGHEERIALDVIPVAMGQEDINRAVFLYQSFAQVPDARASIEHQILTAGCFNVHAGSITAVAVCIVSRRGD
jgi:hypothetical protein